MYVRQIVYTMPVERFMKKKKHRFVAITDLKRFFLALYEAIAKNSNRNPHTVYLRI